MADQQEKEKLIQQCERRTYELEQKMKTKQDRGDEHLQKEVQRLELDRLNSEIESLRVELVKEKEKNKTAPQKARGSMFANQDKKRDHGAQLIKSLLIRKNKISKCKGLFKMWANLSQKQRGSASVDETESKMEM